MTLTLLSKINSPQDLRELAPEQLENLAKELRSFIIDIVSTKEGHLGASLGVVELTIALHYCFDTPTDLLVWDVGHQAYGHKILTGRKAVFETNRRLHGISGFPKREESNFDAFGTGHSSTSISAALGMAISSKLKGNHTKQHIAVIGDASIASGMAFEGLNHAGVTNANLLVILNDNAIGIDPSVGALKTYLTKAKIGKKPTQDNIIEALNFYYEGPVDGHDLQALLKAFENLKAIKGPKLLHVITKKGKGLKQAEEDQVKYHAPGKFDKTTGEVISKEQDLPPKFQEVFGLTLLELAENDESIVGITPAMPTGSSLKYMMDAFPERAFDVGIAEQHAVTLAAGMATQGHKVFCAIYSTFLQRAYDQVIHDVALQNLPVIFCIDRAGLVGNDGATHHGVFDLSFLRCVPNLIIAAPADAIELRQMLYTATQNLQHPIAIRYPRGRSETKDWKLAFEKVQIGKGRCLKEGDHLAVLSLGTISSHVSKSIEAIGDKFSIAHYDLRFLKPLDETLLDKIFNTFQHIITIEDASIKGGFGDAVLEYAQESNFKGNIHKMGIPDAFIEHGSTEELHELAGLSPERIKEKIEDMLA